jgi:hypothetical protein
MRKRILHLTEGVTVRVCRLLEEAAVQAIASGGERIEPACIGIGSSNGAGFLGRMTVDERFGMSTKMPFPRSERNYRKRESSLP